MILASTISLAAGGPGSGCRGPNCGRVRWREGRTDPWSARRKFIMVPMSRIKRDPENQVLKEKVVRKYLSNMKQGKLVTAPMVWKRSNGGIYKLADGHHRFEAAKRFGQKMIKVQVFS